MDPEVERLKAEVARLRAELQSRDADMDEERRAMMFMLEDTNRSVEAAEKAQAKLREEAEWTSHLLMIAEATANIIDLGILMREIVHCVRKILGCEICLIYNWDAETKRFTPSQESGLERESVPQFMREMLKPDMPFVRRVLGGKETPAVATSTEDIMTDAGEGRKEAVLSWLPFGETIAGIPLTAKKTPLGLILAVFRVKKEFAEREIQIMRGMSDQVSVSIEQARLYRETTDRGMELSHKIETIQAMNEIDRSILSSLDPQEIIETSTMMISRVLSCDWATVCLVDTEKRELMYAAGFGTTAVPKGASMPFNDTSAAEVLETGRPQYVANLAGMGELLPLEAALLKEGFLSHIRLPLMVKEEVAAVLSVGSKRPSAFTPSDLSTLEKLASQIGVALQNARQLNDLEQLFLGTVKSLSSAIDAKSPWTAGHSWRVTSFAVAAGKVLGLSERELKDLELAGLLHDVGKIGTYEEILDKPDKLTPEEQAVMRLHPAKGAEILAPIKQLKNIIPGVKHHHEFYDGTGYPEGLKGDAIPLHARILTVADTIDAMSADRPYRKGRSMEVITAEIKRCSGTQFDPRVVEGFLKTIGERE